MLKYLITGGSPLRGEYTVSGAKNAALKMMAAAVLTPEPITLKNVPRVSEIDAMLEILQFLGAKTHWRGQNELTIEAKELSGCAVPVELARKCSASFLLLGVLIARVHEAVVPAPDGGQISRRLVEQVIQALCRLGVKTTREGNFLHAQGKPQSGIIEFTRNTHMGTANILLASVLTPGEVVIKNAAAEPEIDNLILLLNNIGAQIKRIQPQGIHIAGVEKLHATLATVIGDRIETIAAVVAAAVTGGEVVIKGIKSEELTAVFPKLQEIGVSFKVSQNNLHIWVNPESKLQPVVLESGPHPGFMTDWLPLLAVLLTQAEGESLLHETVTPGRFAYLKQLKRMGAEVHLFNLPVEENGEDDRMEHFHAAKIFGQTPLVGTQISLDDAYAGVALVIAALAAKGISELTGAEHIENNYENLVGKLRELGARIEIVQGDS